ncbi:MAG: hypothetical protein KTR27_07985 [Leptolyngbyaceae cyanobacterium MAG.088]|nr:hypothetical protein [Leptolyngbyaceae cyanobacterium MAG.088]
MLKPNQQKSHKGELFTVALTAGYQQTGDPLASLLFMVLYHHAGVQVGISSKAHRGALDQPNVLEQMV